jgi:hypothetical protein
MIMGIMVAVALVVLAWMNVSLRGELVRIVNCVVDDFDRCMGGGSPAAPQPPAPTPMPTPITPSPPPQPCKTVQNPTFNGLPVDWCLTYAANCGQAAADRYCQSQGCGNGALSWSWSGNQNQTTIIVATGQICQNFCGRLTSVVCRP